MNNINNTNNNQGSAQTPQSIEQKPKRQRRSKHEPEGRSFVCEQCSKSYLSKAALTNHFQQKHSDILRQRNIQKKSRGRPRRYVFDNQENDKEKEQFERFFSISHRAIDPKIARSSLEDNCLKAFNEIYKEHSDKMLNAAYTKWDEYPLLKLVTTVNDVETIGLKEQSTNINDANSNTAVINENCDRIMKKYILMIQPMCNDDYLVFVIEFLMLFRECFNATPAKDSLPLEDTSKEASTIQNADKLPEMCNTFFSEYLETRNFLCFKEEKDQTELIEIIQHFCYWLFSNRFTRTRISLSI